MKKSNYRVDFFFSYIGTLEKVMEFICMNERKNKRFLKKDYTFYIT